MSSLKELFSTPKKAALTVACIGVILVTLGICIVVYANGAQGPEPVSAIGGEEAQKYAFADAGVDPAAAKVVEVKYERFQDGFVYEVEFIAGDTQYEYKIDAESGSVVKKELKTVQGPEATGIPGTSIPLEEARAIALSDAGVAEERAVFTEAEQDDEGGIPVYEFQFYAGNVEYEYKINAQTGAVYSKKTTTYVAQPTAPAATNPPTASNPPAQTQPPATSAPTRPPATQAPQPTQPGGSTFIGSEAAKNAALADAGVAAGEARFTHVRMDYEDGVPVYELEFYTSTHEYEYEIHAKTGAVYSRKSEAFHSTGGHHGGQGAGAAPAISLEQAKNAALGHADCAAGDVVFTKAVLDYDDGRAVYEIEFYWGGMEYEYKIDAATGAVLEHEVDTPA